MKDCEILICGYDPYKEVWSYTLHFLFKYWPDCPMKINMMTNFLEVEDERVNTIKTEAVTTWSEGFKKALMQLNKPYVMLFWEDFFVEKPVDNGLMQALFTYAKEHDMMSLRLEIGRAHV